MTWVTSSGCFSTVRSTSAACRLILGKSIDAVGTAGAQRQLVEAEALVGKPLSGGLPVHPQARLHGGCRRSGLVTCSFGVQCDGVGASVLTRQEIFDLLVVVGSEPKLNAHRVKTSSRPRALFHDRMHDTHADKRKTGRRYGS